MNSTTQGSVKIGPSFFANAFRDYSNWVWAWVREIMQNSIDSSKCDQVSCDFSYSHDTDLTTVVFRNNGEPMTSEILFDKFLTLGGSGKRDHNTTAVGCFGKAKELIALAHQSWKIETGTLKVEGVGGDYFVESIEKINGTITTVTMQGNQTLRLSDQFRTFAQRCQWAGVMTVNGEILPTNLKKGTRRRELDWAVIYTNNVLPGTLVVRVHGIPMYSKRINHSGTVLIELNESKYLTANRDGLSWTQERELEEFIEQISINRTTAFKDPKRKRERTRFAGYKLAGRYEKEEKIEEAPIGESINATTETITSMFNHITYYSAHNLPSTPSTPTLTVEQINNVFRPEFYLKSEIEGTIPARFMPDTFSEYSLRLISNWVNLLIELATLAKCTKKFSVGFIFDPDHQGMYEHENGEHIIYINPVSIVKQENRPRQLQNFWKFNSTGNYDLLATAVHEYCHFEGNIGHDETYANRFTQLMSLVLDNQDRFSRYFKRLDLENSKLWGNDGKDNNDKQPS